MAYSFTLQDIDEIRKGKRLHKHIRGAGTYSTESLERKQAVLKYGVYHFEFKLFGINPLCKTCKQYKGSLKCYDQRYPLACYDNLFCSRECYARYDLDKYLDRLEKAILKEELSLIHI